MTLRLCVLISGFADGGAQKQCAYLVRALAARDDTEVTLVYFHDGVHSDLIEGLEVDVVKLETRSNYDPRNILAIRSLLKRKQPHILLTWLQACDVYGYFLRRSLPGLRWVMTERDSYYPPDPRFRLRRALGRCADAIIANSEAGAGYWRAASAKGAITVVPNIVPQALGETASPADRIVSIGRLEPQKNPTTVVDAFSLLAKRRNELTFAVIGAGSQVDALEARALAAGAAGRIEFLGFRKDVAEQISRARVVVSMSHHEGLPNVMIESVAAGRLVVASDIPEHRSLLGDDYPFLVKARTDPSAVASAIEQALACDAPGPLLAFARKRLAVMTPAAVVDAYMKAFDAVLGGRP